MAGCAITALAPMQDITNLQFMRLVDAFGPPDFFFTEYFRVHATSRLDPSILASITENNTGRPVFAQLIGESLPDLERTVEDLSRFPVAGIDLNLGCPAPKVYRKNVGGGLLRDPARIHSIVRRLRQCHAGLLTIKMRIGFDSTENFLRIIDILNQNDVDLISIHGRTVKEMYRGEAHYDMIHAGVQRARCPVLANGNISSAESAAEVLRETGAYGVMIGRGAIRNPWIFRQTRELLQGVEPFLPALGDLRNYVDDLMLTTAEAQLPERNHLNRMKKFLNFVGQSIDAKADFLHAMRRTGSIAQLLQVCDRFMVHGGKYRQPFVSVPFPGVYARPNREGPLPSVGPTPSFSSRRSSRIADCREYGAPQLCPQESERHARRRNTSKLAPTS